ncbi:MAG: Bax inhibitor-1 family protein [bacterium]|nr:Bax inhibitor-1 family protein [bacterium]
MNGGNSVISATGRGVHDLGASDRAALITAAYTHLLGAVVIFVLLEWWLFASGLAERIARPLMSVNWLYVLGAYMIVAWIASHYAHRSTSRAGQYMALIAYILAKTVIFVPLLTMAERRAPGVISSAGAMTVAGFAVLTVIAITTRRDFAFLRGFLLWGGFVALGLIVTALLFGFTLGPLFSVVMVAYAGAAILYDTSNILHRYRRDRYVAAALELFASVALLLWYLVRLYSRFPRSRSFPG